MIVKMIAAVSQNGYLGDADLNDIPWKARYPQDFKYFRQMTMGGEVVFGRRTYESIKKPLSNRSNVVITRQTDIAGVQCFPSIQAWAQNRRLVLEDTETTKWLCGGSAIYREGLLLPEIKDIYLTLIPEVLNCNNPVAFPWINPTKFEVTNTIALDGDLKVLRYTRISK